MQKQRHHPEKGGPSQKRKRNYRRAKFTAQGPDKNVKGQSRIQGFLRLIFFVYRNLQT